MPPATQVNMDFLRQVLKGEKMLLKKSAVKFIDVKRFDELSVKNLWVDLSKDEAFKIYFPDKYPQDKWPNRKYMFDTLNSVYPEYLENIMLHATK